MTVRPRIERRVWTDTRRLRVLGTGSALPGPAVATGELLELVERRFGVDVQRRGLAYAARLGIAERHLCRDFAARHERPRAGHSNPELAAAALGAALDEAGLTPGDLDYLIGHTTSPARLVPPNVALLADRLGYDGPYMELRQACTGFANALVVAQGLLAGRPGARAVAIVGSETGSVYFDPQRAAEDTGQLVNLVQMGDAAAAIVLGPDDGGDGAVLSRNFFGQIGLGREPGFMLCGGGSDDPFLPERALEFAHAFAAVRSNGPELFARAIETAGTLGVDAREVPYLLPHQANGHLAELLGAHLDVPPARVFVNADRVGNTGSTAIWLGLDQLRARLAPGERVLALGAEATKFMFGGFLYAHGAAR